MQVTCQGHVIGAIIANTQAEAQRAARAVKIQYEELPAIVTIKVLTCRFILYMNIYTETTRIALLIRAFVTVINSNGLQN